MSRALSQKQEDYK